MIAELEKLDRSLFLLINGSHAPWLDSVMWFLSEKFVWIPFYLFLLISLMIHYGWKRTLIWIIPAVAITITLCDQVSVKLFKEVFERYRPCHNIELSSLVHLVDNHCGGQFGFVSSHAANSFGLATFVLLLTKWRPLAITMIIWAVMVSYSRIYLGVHYPGDVIGGAILGVLIGGSIALFLKSKLKS